MQKKTRVMYPAIVIATILVAAISYKYYRSSIENPNVAINDIAQTANEETGLMIDDSAATTAKLTGSNVQLGESASEEVRPLSKPRGIRTQNAVTTLQQDERLKMALKKALNAERLPAEQIYFNDDSVEGDRIFDLLKGNDFDNSLNQLEQDAQYDPLALELQELYRNHLLDAIQGVGESAVAANLDRFACGIRACFGSISGLNAEEYEIWRTNFATNPNAPHGAYAVFQHTNQFGVIEYRFFMTTDATNSFRIPRGK